MEKESQMTPVSNTNNPNPATAPIFVEYYSHESADCYKILMPFTKYASEKLVLCPVSEGLEKAQDLARTAILKRVNELLPATQPITHPSPGAQADKCPECDGIGYHADTVGRDPGEHCSHCDGTGRIQGGDNSAREAVEAWKRDIQAGQNAGTSYWVLSEIMPRLEGILSLITAPESETAKPTLASLLEEHEAARKLYSVSGAFDGFAEDEDTMEDASNAHFAAFMRAAGNDLPEFSKPTPSTPSDMDKGEGASHADADALIRIMMALIEVEKEESPYGLPPSQRAWLNKAHEYASARGDKSLHPIPPVSGTATEAGAWTQQKPTEGDNHYHFREKGGKGRTIIFLSGDGDEAVTFYNGRREYLGNLHGEWSGPISTPKQNEGATASPGEDA